MRAPNITVSGLPPTLPEDTRRIHISLDVADATLLVRKLGGSNITISGSIRMNALYDQLATALESIE